jgi:hypothetical protein
MEIGMTTRGSGRQHSEPAKTTEATVNTATKAGSRAAEAAAESAEATVDTAAENARKAAEAAAEAVSDIPREDVPTTTDDAIDAVVSGQTEATRALESIGRTMLVGATRMQEEIVDFVSIRVRQDMETQKELLRCRSFDDVREVQTKYFQTAMEQYAAESKRLMELSSEVIQRSANRGA